MLVDKKNGTVVSGNTTNAQKVNKVNDDNTKTITELSEMPDNSIVDVYKAIKEIVKGVRWKYNDEKSELIFKTVQFNGSQYEYIIEGDTNPMAEIAFPAAFIHFINVRCNSSQSSINNGTAELRIRVVMNTLNNYDDDKDTVLYYVCQRVIQTITEQRYNYDCLKKYLKLTYVDTADRFHDGLQAAWITFDVKFQEISVWVKRNRTTRYIVAPPFTNHSDQSDPKTQNIHNHTNADHPQTYDEATSYDLKTESE